MFVLPICITPFFLSLSNCFSWKIITQLQIDLVQRSLDSTNLTQTNTHSIIDDNFFRH